VVAADYSHRSGVVGTVATSAFAVVVRGVGVEAGTYVIGIAFARFFFFDLGCRRFFFVHPFFFLSPFAYAFPGLTSPRLSSFASFGSAPPSGFLPRFLRFFSQRFLLEGARFAVRAAAGEHRREADQDQRCNP